MRPVLPVLVTLVACGGPPPAREPAAAPAPVVAPAPAPPAPGPPPDPFGIDWSDGSWKTDDGARAIWPRLGLTWDNWLERIELVPDRAGLREALAKALLRDGGFACPSVPIPVTCELTHHEWAPTPPDAGIDHPCLRRELARWALVQLDDDDLTDVLPDLLALASLPPPEEDLVRSAILRAPDEAHVLTALDLARRAGNPVVDDSLARLSDAGLIAAVLDHDIDAALEILDVATAQPTYERAVTALGLRPETRIYAIRQLADHADRLDRRDLERASARGAIAGALRDPSCDVAGIAVAALARIDDKPVTVAAPPTAAELPRAVCVAVHARAETGDDAALRALIPSGSLIVEHHTPDPGAGDGDPPTWKEIERVVLDRDGLPFATDLERALPRCDGAVCELRPAGVRFRLVGKRGPKNRWQLHTLERHEIPAGC